MKIQLDKTSDLYERKGNQIIFRSPRDLEEYLNHIFVRLHQRVAMLELNLKAARERRRK